MDAPYLPDEVLIRILSELDSPQAVVRTCTVDKRFSNICHDRTLWRRLLVRDYGHFYELTDSDPYEIYRDYTKDVSEFVSSLVDVATDVDLDIELINVGLINERIYNIVIRHLRKYLDGEYYQAYSNIIPDSLKSQYSYVRDPDGKVTGIQKEWNRKVIKTYDLGTEVDNRFQKELADDLNNAITGGRNKNSFYRRISERYILEVYGILEKYY
jgi:hypothetical protein